MGDTYSGASLPGSKGKKGSGFKWSGSPVHKVFQKIMGMSGGGSNGLVRELRRQSPTELARMDRVLSNYVNRLESEGRTQRPAHLSPISLSHYEEMSQMQQRVRQARKSR